MKTIRQFFLIGIILLAVAGCERAFVAKTKIAQDEQVSVKAPVYVDGVQAGYVKNLQLENGDRIAELAITNKQLAAKKMKVGIVRVVEKGRINLLSDGVKPDAARLDPGTLIPTKTKVQYTIQKYATIQTLIAVGIGLVAVLLLGLILKSVFKFSLLVLCLGLAGLTAWVVHPYAAPIVHEFYAASPQARDSSQPPPSNAAPAPEQLEGEKVKNFEAQLIEILDRRPNPRAPSPLRARPSLGLSATPFFWDSPSAL
jgi:hypothetical protein